MITALSTRTPDTAIESAVPISPRLGAAIGKPVEDPFLATLPGDIIPNRDAVLTKLAPRVPGLLWTDERVWLIMERDHKIAEARRHIESDVFSAEFSIREGKSGSAGAAKLADFARQLWCRVPHQRTVMKRIFDAHFWGWRPMQVLVDASMRFEGRPAWAPFKIVDKEPHRVRLTSRDTLVWLPMGWGGGLEFSGPARHLGWLTWSTGTLDTPYGRGLHHHAFMLWLARREIFRKVQVGVERSLGALKVKGVAGANASSLQDSIEEVKEDIEALIDLFNSHNIIVETGMWTVDFLDGIDQTASGVKILEHFDDAVMSLYTGVTLTSNIREGGSRAAAEVHKKVRSEGANDAALEAVEAPITDLLRGFIVAHFGEVDHEDLPYFVSSKRLAVSPDAAKTLFAFGAPLRARVLAESWGAGDILADDHAPDELVLQAVSALTASTEGDRVRVSESSSIDRMLDLEVERARPALRSYLDELGESFLAKHGLSQDPKA